MEQKTKVPNPEHAERMRQYWASKDAEFRKEHGEKVSGAILANSTPAERSIRQSAANYKRENRVELAKRAQQAWLEKLADEKDPEHALPESERMRLAKEERKRLMRIRQAKGLRTIRMNRQARQK